MHTRRTFRLLFLVLLPALLVAGCGDDGTDRAAEDTQAGLRAHLTALQDAIAASDVEAIHALQGADCDDSIGDVTIGFETARDGLTEAGLDFEEFIGAFEFEIVDYESDPPTATVLSRYAGSDEALQALPTDELYYRYDGGWTSADSCFGSP